MWYPFEDMCNALRRAREEEETAPSTILDVPKSVWTNIKLGAAQYDVDPVEMAAILLADGAFALWDDYLLSEEGRAMLSEQLEKETGTEGG